MSKMELIRDEIHTLLDTSEAQLKRREYRNLVRDLRDFCNTILHELSQTEPPYFPKVGDLVESYVSGRRGHVVEVRAKSKIACYVVWEHRIRGEWSATKETRDKPKPVRMLNDGLRLIQEAQPIEPETPAPLVGNFGSLDFS